MSSESPQHEFGYFGKLPTFGDFIHQILPQDFANNMHQWTQQCMAAARENLGEDFLTWYLNCPAWKFLMTAEACGVQPVAGLTIPSVDKVGRYFNFTLATMLPPGTNVLAYGLSNRSGFLALERLALDLLEQDLPREAIDIKVREVTLEFSPVPAVHADIEATADYLHVSLDQPLPFLNQESTLLSHLLKQQLGPYSVWWHGQEGQTQSKLVACRGLPSPEVYLRFLTSETMLEPADQEGSANELDYVDKIIAGEI